MSGIPARYVTGLVGASKGMGYYIFRANNLHAWAEAWNGESWEIVEATPPSGQPSSTQTSDLLDWLSFLKDRFFAMDLLKLLTNSVLIPFLLTVLLVCIGLIWLLRTLLQRKPWQKRDVLQISREKELLILLEQKLGISRDVNETLEEYRLRVRSDVQLQEKVRKVADSFITLYSKRVYGKKQINVSELEQMMLLVPELEKGCKSYLNE